MKMEELRGAYLGLLRDRLTGLIYDDPPTTTLPAISSKRALGGAARAS